VPLFLHTYLLHYYFIISFQYTQKKAKELHIVGWVMNTHRGTVLGQLQGSTEAVKSM
jgi:acylphosphatase